jgi:hypothetical protein
MAASPMKLGFEESQSPFSSGSQKARTWTEAWVRAWAYCPHCGNARISSFPNNSPLADFFCGSCSEEFELKSQRGKFGAKVLDGEFNTKRIWTDQWSATCDDDCPHCGARHMSPFDSETLTTLIEQDGKEFVVLRSPDTAGHDPDYRELGRFATRKQALAFLEAGGD